VSDAHAGLKKAIAQVLGCPWQRCSVHFLREALGHAHREQQPMLAALIRPIFNAEDREQAGELLGAALERVRKPLPKIADLLEEAEEDLLAFYAFPADHRAKLRSTDEKVKRSCGLAGDFGRWVGRGGCSQGLRAAPVALVQRRSVVFRACGLFPGRYWGLRAVLSAASAGVTLSCGRG
jgi:Transposase, Mutator family